MTKRDLRVDPVGLHHFYGLDGGVEVPAAVGVDHELAVRPDPRTDEPQPLHVLSQLETPRLHLESSQGAVFGQSSGPLAAKSQSNTQAQSSGKAEQAASAPCLFILLHCFTLIMV